MEAVEELEEVEELEDRTVHLLETSSKSFNLKRNPLVGGDEEVGAEADDNKDGDDDEVAEGTVGTQTIDT